MSRIEQYRTIRRTLRHEMPKVKGSRFIATASPIASAAAAGDALRQVREELGGATHHCFAYRLGPDGSEFRFDDDGEPGGSAGRPILQQIEGHEMTGIVVVVTRFFGGTKLGVGGLVRAYGGAAGAALDRADVRVVPVTRTVVVEYPYDCSGEVQGLLAAAALAPVSSDYGESVRLVLRVPVASVDEFLGELAERTAGRARVE